MKRVKVEDAEQDTAKEEPEHDVVAETHEEEEEMENTDEWNKFVDFIQHTHTLSHCQSFNFFENFKKLIKYCFSLSKFILELKNKHTKT